MPRVIRHLGEGGQAQIRLAEVRGGGARAGHVDRLEAGRLDQAGGEAIVGARRDDDAGSLEHVAESGRGSHDGKPFPGVRPDGGSVAI